MNIFVLIKTSSEDEDERRLHPDECLLGGWLSTINNVANGARKLEKKL